MPFVSNLARSPDQSIQPVQQQQLYPASGILSSPKALNQKPQLFTTIPNLIKISLTPPLNSSQMTNPRPETETANSPNSVLETPSGNNYSTHTTFVPNFDPRETNQSSAPRPSLSCVPDNSQPRNHLNCKLND
ncbi:hypothetical protein PPACK8108_LOCUS4881 [Phakopsora pachyrhizi]|uniref:Uncharacterized protein n=1 Tax=Phakopsora pachyrhizi TaxID=170000 RepID=A0AAV0AMT8_PHAPC|nr:hypothetical protein PPACK8108_LOCUS4881 [Phakopsora pachyrhizi]